MNTAQEYLDRLTCEVLSITSQLLSYAGPDWRNQTNLESNLTDIKITTIRLKMSLHKFVDFCEGCLGNAVNALDKGKIYLLETVAILYNGLLL